MILKKWALPLCILVLILFIKCKDSPTQVTTTASQVTQTTPQAEVGAPGSAPVQLAPSDTANGVARKPQFQWRAVEGADAYQLDASHGDQMVIQQRVDSATFTPSKALSGEETYYWRVRAIDGKTKGRWSKIHSFTTSNSIIEQLSAPEQLAPSDTANDVARKPQFKWKAVEGADGYQLDASHGDQEVIHQRVDEATFTPSKALSGGKTYYWRVRAINGETKGKWSEIHSFTTSNSISEQLSAPGSAPEQVAPLDTANGVARKPQFKWKAVEGADAYQLDASHGDQMVIHQRVDSANFTPNKALLGEETYYWRVRVINGETKGKWSEIHSFTTTYDDKDTVPTELQAPKDNADDRPVNLELQWKKVTGASKYKVQLAHGEQFKSIVVNESVEATSYKVTDLKHHEEYAWRVKPVVPDKEAEWSEAYTFTTSSTQAISLLSPDNDVSDQPGGYSLSWKPLPGISQYQVQIAPRSDFATLVADETTGDATYKLSGLDNNKTYYWRVQAIGDGNSSNWSAVRSFRTKAAQNNGSSTATTDRQALMDLYKATGGEHWNNNSGWGSSASLDSWYGIKTNAQGRVTRVDLFKNNLKGQLPTSLGNLDKVTYLNVKNNYLTGKIPPEIGNMESLETLILQGRTYDSGGNTYKEPPDDWNHGYHPGKHLSNTNDLSGKIPSTIGNLSNLIILEIANAPNIKGPIPSEIGNLSKLKGLYLSFDDFSGTTLPSSIGDLTNLKNLYIAGSELEGSIPASFQNLTQLTQINLAKVSNHNTGLPSNHLTGNIPDFSNFTELRGLSLSENDLDGEYPSYLNNGNFNKLRTLNLAHNNLTGTLPNFNNLQSLQSLTLSGNKLTGSIDAFTTLPDQIQIISAGWNNFSGDFPNSGWPDFYQLKTVYMNDNNLTGSIPCSFWDKLDNPKLIIAKFGNNNFSSTCKSGAQSMKGAGNINLNLYLNQ